MTPRRFALRLTGGRSFLFHRYAADAACPTDCSKQFPGLPSNACSDPSFMPDPLPAHDYHDFAIEDTLRVPSDLPPGDYVRGGDGHSSRVRGLSACDGGRARADGGGGGRSPGACSVPSDHLPNMAGARLEVGLRNVLAGVELVCRPHHRIKVPGCGGREESGGWGMGHGARGGASGGRKRRKRESNGAYAPL